MSHSFRSVDQLLETHNIPTKDDHPGTHHSYRLYRVLYKFYILLLLLLLHQNIDRDFVETSGVQSWLNLENNGLLLSKGQVL